jgi:hypothetical protein
MELLKPHVAPNWTLPATDFDTRIGVSGKMTVVMVFAAEIADCPPI